jgi:GrpB-like predicted nucleotidyltransferase (UPF0157 family)
VRDADDFDEQLDRVLVGGREEREVRIEPSTEEWPRRFAVERERIDTALGSTARRIEHIGSTAVPGLAAKPIVDILVSVDDPDDESTYVGALEHAGYQLRVRESRHRMFRTPERDVHVHVWAPGSAEERDHLLFRDWLRSHPDSRVEYERTKRSLAGSWRDMNHYARAKAPVIERILDHARRAQGEPEPSPPHLRRIQGPTSLTTTDVTVDARRPEAS